MLDLSKDINLFNGDCLEVMKGIPDGSVDMILCDLPYGTTKNKWDSVIPFDLLWEQYERVIKERGMIALTAAQPFATSLISSNMSMFKYDLVWDKKMPTGFLNAKRQPLRRHELVLCFYKKMPKYNPIMREGKERSKGGKIYSLSDCYGNIKQAKEKEIYNLYYPTSILEFSNANQKDKVHPTQKPLGLMDWLVETYTDKRETVLDNCMGSGSTGVACKNLNRKFIGIELDETYFNIAKERIANA